MFFSRLLNPTRLLSVLLLLGLLSACGQTAGPSPRYAIVRFENLSGDPSLEWVGFGASDFLSRSLQTAMDGPVLSPDAIGRSSQALGVHSASAPGISAQRTSAMVAGANRVISGYVERSPGGVRITASEENVVTHRSLLTLSASAASSYEALKLLAKKFSDKAGAPATTNEEALRLYCLSLEGTATDAPLLLERAVALDPAFGRAWLGLVRTLMATGDRARAVSVIEQARAQKLAPVDRANLDFEEAGLENDRAASLAALRKMYTLSAGDNDLGRSLAQAETAGGNFREAAAVWKKLTVDTPADTNAWNQLGYTLCWGGDYAGALAAIRHYATLRPNDSNPLDSEGDIHYWFGKFSLAASSYLAAHARSSAFLEGGGLYKAAWAKFRAGDKTGAETLFGQFRDLREKAGDHSVVLFAGDWLYRTGRPQEAIALLRDAAAKKSGPNDAAISAVAAIQLTVWDLLAGDRAAAAKDAATLGNAGLTPAALLARFATLPSASAGEWDARATHLLAAPQLAALRESALGYALIFDDKKQAAIPVWERIVKQSAGNDFFSRAVLARLKGQAAEHVMLPDAVNLNEFAAVPDKL